MVEASKASTGNIKLEMNDIDFVEMVQQVIGEFEEKFQEKNLTMMVHFTDEPSIIYADGQRMWRVLENVFGNVVKYAMEGTRVYAEISNRNKKSNLSLKNISAQPLNISADELTERFIRGDVAKYRRKRTGTLYRKEPDRAAGEVSLSYTWMGICLR